MDSKITPGLQTHDPDLGTPTSTHLGIPRRRGHSSWGFKRVVSGFCTCLVAVSVFFMIGCSDDDDEDEELADVSNARISDPGSVFGLFAERGDEGFVFPGGLFGPQDRSNTTTTLSFSNVNAAGTESTATFRTVSTDPTEPSGEGSADGVDSCNYQYIAGRRQPCPLCDFMVTATAVPCGGTGPGQIVLQLAGADNATTRQSPTFVSTAIPVTVELDSDCNLVSIDGVAVTVEAQQ